MKKSMAAPSTMAYAMQQTFQNSIARKPTGRDRGGQCRNTMANWVVIRSEQWFVLLYDRLRRELLEQDIMNMDEIRCYVLKKVGRESKQMSPIWVFCPPRKRILYCTSTISESFRSRAFPRIAGAGDCAPYNWLL